MALKRSHLSPRTRAYTKAGAVMAEVVIGAAAEGFEDKLPPSEHDYGWKPVWLKLMIGSRRPIWISLTSMTGEELRSLKQLLDVGFEDALVIADALDDAANAMLLRDDIEDVPTRALASAPPWFDREINLSYDRGSEVDESDAFMTEGSGMPNVGSEKA